MHILLDESVPGRLGPLLIGHSTISVQRRGWASMKNGKLPIKDAANTVPPDLATLLIRKSD